MPQQNDVMPRLIAALISHSTLHHPQRHDSPLHKGATSALLALVLAWTSASAADFHVAVTGNDTAPGTTQLPLRTIQHAADLAQPGDTVTVHAGIYRERVDPPRGGESDAKRITYQVAPGERVEIRGSEVVTGWTLVKDGVWKAEIR